MDGEHNWKSGEPLQYSLRGMPPSAACTPWECVNCGVRFHHRYNIQPDIHKAMKAEGVPDVCPEPYRHDHQNEVR